MSGASCGYGLNNQPLNVHKSCSGAVLEIVIATKSAEIAITTKDGKIITKEFVPERVKSPFGYLSTLSEFLALCASDDECKMQHEYGRLSTLLAGEIEYFTLIDHQAIAKEPKLGFNRFDLIVSGGKPFLIQRFRRSSTGYISLVAVDFN